MAWAVPLTISLCLCTSLASQLAGNCGPGSAHCIARLVAAAAEVEVQGALAFATLSQVFAFDSTAEQVKDSSFIFPIHEGVVVTGLTAQINDHVINAKVMERQAAFAAFTEAVQQGSEAALGSHGPAAEKKAEDGKDLYRISLGNVATRKLAYINISFVQEPALEATNMQDPRNFLRFLLPAMRLPPHRYCAGGGSCAERGLEAMAAQRSWEADAPSARLGSFRVRTVVRPAATVTSPSHGHLIVTRKEGDTGPVTAELEMGEEHEEELNRDVVLRIHFEEEKLPLRAVLEQHPVTKTWAGLLEMVPSFDWDLLDKVEVTFLVDRSGSMRGKRIQLARGALEHFVRSMPAEARVNLVGFGSTASRLFDGAEKLRGPRFGEAVTYARRLEANLGGTEMHSPLETVLSAPLSEGCELRRVLVLTDGAVWNSDQLLRTTRRLCQANCSVHTLGLGDGASTALVEGLARAGHGTARFVADGEEEDLEETVVSIMAAALQAPADGFTIDWPRSPLLLKRGGSLPDSVASAQSRDSRIERFVSQGGFLWGPLEVSPLAPAYWGRRWFAYAFLGRLNGDQLPETIRVSGKRRGQPFNLSAPVARRDGQALHTMAAWHLVESLESFPHSVLGEAHGLPNPEDKQWQSVGVAVCYGIATVKTSWVAIKREATIASQTRTTEDTTLSVGGASSLSVYGLARFGSSVSVLDFAYHGSSMALRSFARLGSTLAVYGLARLGSSLSVLDCVQLGSSMALRSFARMGSSVAILDFLSCGSSLSLRSFCRLGSRFSVLGSSWSQNISGPSLDLADSPSAESPDLPLKKKVAFVFMEFADLHVPVASIDCEAPAPSCLCSISSMNLTGLIKRPTSLFLSAKRNLTSLDADVNMSSLHVLENCSLRAGSRSVAFLNLSDFHQSLDVEDKTRISFLLDRQLEDEVEPKLSKWFCPKLPSSAYAALIQSQQDDGSFHWPKAFFRVIGNENGETLVEVSQLLSSATALAALRRCFWGTAKWRLIEIKTLAYLQSQLKDNLKVERLIIYANIALLQQMMFSDHLNARPGSSDQK